MKLMEFTEGSSVTNFVGKKNLFENKLAFLKACVVEFAPTLEDYLDDEAWSKKNTFEDISVVHDEIYCRYYRRIPDEYAYLDMESGYLFSRKGQGAFEVYTIDVSDLVGAIKAS